MKRRQPLFSFVAMAREVVSNRAITDKRKPRLNVRSHGDRHPLWLGVSVFVPLSDETKEEERKMKNHIEASSAAQKRAWIYIRKTHTPDSYYNSLEETLRSFAAT